MPVTTYNPKKVAVTFRNQVLTGFMDDTFVEFSRDEDSFTKHTGADGEVSRAQNANKGAKLTLTLKQTSASNDRLSEFFQQDEISGTGIGILSVVDASGRTVISVPEAWIQKPADVTLGKTIVGRAWTFDCAEATPLIAGNI